MAEVPAKKDAKRTIVSSIREYSSDLTRVLTVCSAAMAITSATKPNMLLAVVGIAGSSGDQRCRPDKLRRSRAELYLVGYQATKPELLMNTGDDRKRRSF